MKLVCTLVILISASVFAGLSLAEDITQDLTRDGFGDVANILASMTPEQRAAVMKQAQAREKELQKMTPEQQEQLRKQLRATADTIDMDKVDPAKLDMSKAKNTAKTQKDLDSYQQKYQQGKIKNAVVRPH